MHLSIINILTGEEPAKPIKIEATIPIKRELV